MDKIKCITFDKQAQDNLPEHVKAKMKADREKARQEQLAKGLNIAEVMQRAFDCMMNENLLELSEKGKIELEKCWENSSKDKWHIHSIGVLNTLEICSDGHMIFRSAPLDWFVWHVA